MWIQKPDPSSLTLRLIATEEVFGAQAHRYTLDLKGAESSDALNNRYQSQLHFWWIYPVLAWGYRCIREIGHAP